MGASAAVRPPHDDREVTEKAKTGSPDDRHHSTSSVERPNLLMRMFMRRFTHLTNGLSKRLEHHAATVARYFMYYN